MSSLPAVKNTSTECFLPEEIDILKATIMPGATTAELALFGKVCAQTGLSPFARQIFPVGRDTYDKELKRKVKKWTFQTSVDGFRLVAQRSEQYEGQTATQWCGEDGKWVDVWLKADYPAAARVGVWRKNFREPLYAIAVWESYVQKFKDFDTGKEEVSAMWNKMPDLMLAKCAECLALRKAFPQELSGIYSKEEMEQSETESKPSDNKPSERHGLAASEITREVVNEPTTSRVTPSVPVIQGKSVSPDEFITVGQLQGKKIDELGVGVLNVWASNASEHFIKSKIDPNLSMTDMARSYRRVLKQISELQASPFSKVSNAGIQVGNA